MGRAGIDAAFGNEPLRGLVDDEAVGGHALGFGQRLLGARHRRVGIGRVARQDDRADRQHGPYRAMFRLDDAFARHFEEAFGGVAQFLLIAVVEDDGEFAARIARDRIAGAHHILEPAAHRDDDLVGHFETIGVIDDSEIVDAGDDERA